MESQNKTIEALREELKRSNENMEYLIQKLYGRKTEKTFAIDGQLVINDIELGLFNEAESEMDPAVLEPVPFEEPIKRTRKGYKRKDLFKDLPSHDQVFKIEESKQICPTDGNRLSVVGNKFVRSEIRYVPAEVSVVNIYQETYECRTCKKENRPGMFSPSTPEPVLQHSYATDSSVAWTMYQKFVQAVPLYRQEKDWKQMGFPLSRATLSNWIIKTSEEWLNPVVEKLHEELLKEKYLHADETPVQVFREEGKKNTTKSYMWVYSTSTDSKHGIRIFKYAKGRTGDNAKDFLKGFNGYLHTDGYTGYGKVKDIHHCLCWAHVRRYFKDALPKDMESPEATLPATGIAYCNQLFDWERKFKSLSPEDRKKMRLEKEKPVLDAFWSWVESSNEKVLPKSNIGKALQYALNHKEKLETYLEDGNCVISNNIAENSIRPFTIGRKNWTFCGSPEGANASACVYTLVETAKANGLNPYKYLEFVLSRLPGSDFKTNPKILDLMMPWAELIQKTCKA
ncbi:IS66 family transposase [Tissierella sp. DSM 105185]|uniref:IS66 family transposase n=1 Tax=Tissierella pigra TaxID=2607614 RepID=A0A6N7XJ35_9FIRM|nr:IS66 family transposase [Tissierella pigra]